MKYYIFTDYASGEKALFDNLNSAMEFVKDYQFYDIEEYEEVVSSFSLDEIPVINPSFEDWIGGRIENKTLMDTCENPY